MSFDERYPLPHEYPGLLTRYAGIPQSTLTNWVTDSEGSKVLKLPSGKLLRVTDILGIDANIYSVVEATDWFELAVDLLVNPGRTAKGLKQKLGDFLRWFAVKGWDCFRIHRTMVLQPHKKTV